MKISARSNEFLLECCQQIIMKSSVHLNMLLFLSLITSLTSWISFVVNKSSIVYILWSHSLYRHTAFNIEDKCFGKSYSSYKDVFLLLIYVVTFEPDPITLPHATSTIFYAPNTSGMCVCVCACVRACVCMCIHCLSVMYAFVSVFLSQIYRRL